MCRLHRCSVLALTVLRVMYLLSQRLVRSGTIVVWHRGGVGLKYLQGLFFYLRLDYRKSKRRRIETILHSFESIALVYKGEESVNFDGKV